MKIFIILTSLVLITHCSFDNKSGIWQNKNTANSNNNSQFKDFKTLSSTDDTFNKIVPIKKNFTFKIEKKNNKL